jgi:serine/threonine protein kinase
VGRHVALKFLHEQYAQRSCMVQRFLREAQAAGSIASEHIIGVLDYGTTDGTPYLVMELVRGQDLREILTETPRLPPSRAVSIVLDACRGLALAHERGLIHRDLKPANICVTRRSDGREVAKVIDFGVAKLRDGAELSEEGTLIGTLGYMAPEQLTDQKELDARADIYALGVILYQALSGRPPHVCNRSELLYRIVSVDPKPLDDLCADLPLGLAAVVHKALCRNKERRYTNVREFAAALEPFAGHEPPSPPILHARTENLSRDALSREALSREALPRQSSSRDALTREALSREELSREDLARAGSFDEGAERPRHTAEAHGAQGAEFGNAPTWAALARTTNSKADRQCERWGDGRDARGSVEEYCRHPDGLPPPPAPAHHHQLSQRALLLSVGALALSVVAMMTMFVFVYSHGSGALEAAAKTSSRATRALAVESHAAAASGRVSGSGLGTPTSAGSGPAPLDRAGAALDAPSAPVTSAALATSTQAERCGTEHLQAASVTALATQDHGSITVQRHALNPSRGEGPYPGARPIECE